MEKGRKYNLSIVNYSAGGNITVMKDCNSVAVVNVGDTIAEINGIPLFPSATPATVRGDAVSINGNEGELYKGNLRLAFRVPIGAAPQVIIIQQFYVEEYKNGN